MDSLPTRSLPKLHSRPGGTLCSILLWGCQVAFYIGYTRGMLAAPMLSHTAAMILQAIHSGYLYGYNLMGTTGLPSGTVYPALRRLEQDGLIHSHRERQSIADAGQRPPRKYYKLTQSGKVALRASHKRYPLLARLVPALEVENV
jgi:PadR family transcriptional regulator, regulatory protein PadR